IGYLLYRYFFWPKFSDAAFDALLAFTYVSNWWRAFDLPGISYMSHTWPLLDSVVLRRSEVSRSFCGCVRGIHCKEIRAAHAARQGVGWMMPPRKS
ncbi:MAG TPA: hypothetical protein VFP79_05900, partial [Pseudolabrys sp.]|nr:hypothetical protein [Pseudolabrys sp.]